MIDSKQLIDYTKHPELVLQSLNLLLTLLESNDETDQNCATDLLENCGAPRLSQVPFLCQQLTSGISLRVYWASTLLGRIGETFGEPVDRSRTHAVLCSALSNESLELSARERAAWAIGETGGVDAACREILQKQMEKAPARLKRLLETAIAN